MNKNMIYTLSALTLYFLYKKYNQFKILRIIPSLLEKNGTIIDVRSEVEFKLGHKEGTINIPHNQILKKIGNLKTKGPIILCCASGTRSAMAKKVLESYGLKDIYNAGRWKSLKKITI